MEIKIAIDKFLLDRSVYCAPDTIRFYRETLSYFITHTNCTDTDEITKEWMQRYIIILRKQVKDVSVRTYCRAVTVFVHWLEEEGMIPAYPFRGLKLPRQDAEPVYPLMQSEVDTILKTFDTKYVADFSGYDWKMWRNQILFLLLLDAGLRSSEVRNLKISDVSLTQRFIRIRHSKGQKSRVVPLSHKLQELLVFYLPKLPDKNGYVLRPLRSMDSSKRQPISENTIKSFFSKLKIESGISRVHAHLLRHTFATSFLYGGGDLETLRLLLGHSDYNVTQNYLHLSLEYKLTGAQIYQLDPIFFKKGY